MTTLQQVEEALDTVMKDRQPVMLQMSKFQAFRLVQVLQVMLTYPDLGHASAVFIVDVAMSIELANKFAPPLQAVLDMGWERDGMPIFVPNLRQARATRKEPPPC